MKKIIFILLLLPLVSFSQNFQTNNPDIVFPLVEKFISEAHSSGLPTYYKIKEIDSISIKLLKDPYTGFHIKQGLSDKIELHNHFYEERIREKTFFHEMGHLWGLKHSNNPKSIMYQGYNNWFNYDGNWKQAKKDFFNDIKNNL